MNNYSSLFSRRPSTSRTSNSKQSRARPISAVSIEGEKENHFLHSMINLNNEQYLHSEIGDFERKLIEKQKHFGFNKLSKQKSDILKTTEGYRLFQKEKKRIELVSQESETKKCYQRILTMIKCKTEADSNT